MSELLAFRGCVLYQSYYHQNNHHRVPCSCCLRACAEYSIRRARWLSPSAIRHFARLTHFKEGDIAGLRMIVDLLQKAEEQSRLHQQNDRRPLDEGVTLRDMNREDLLQINAKLFITLRDLQMTTRSKEEALQVLAAICLQLDHEEIADVIDYIFQTLDMTSDPEVSALSGSCGNRIVVPSRIV